MKPRPPLDRPRTRPPPRRWLAPATLVAGALLALAMGPATASAGAPSPPPNNPATAALAAEVTVLHATNAGGGIDGRVGNLAQLKKPPFSAYDTYKLLTQARTPLTQGTESPSALPDGGNVRMTLKQAVGSGRRKMAVTIHKPDGSVFLPLAEVTMGTGEPFFVAGYRHKNGILVIGIKLVG
ncbi:MAG TPA: hypothetical protein VFS43_03295 [Polyangiaceae bacterium]|nr:hypothetical protein [Polyangiaceae bacterium]